MKERKMKERGRGGERAVAGEGDQEKIFVLPLRPHRRLSLPPAGESPATRLKEEDEETEKKGSVMEGVRKKRRIRRAVCLRRNLLPREMPIRGNAAVWKGEASLQVAKQRKSLRDVTTHLLLPLLLRLHVRLLLVLLCSLLSRKKERRHDTKGLRKDAKPENKGEKGGIRKRGRRMRRRRRERIGKRTRPEERKGREETSKRKRGRGKISLCANREKEKEEGGAESLVGLRTRKKFD